MFGLEDITVKELYQQTPKVFESYMELQHVLNAKPMFSNKPAKKLESLTFGEVAKLKRIVMNIRYEGLIEAFTMVFGTNKVYYEMASVTDYLPALKYINHSISILVKREMKLLSSESDPELDLAGVEKLNKFAELNVLIDLGKKFGKSPDEIQNWRYGTVFSIMLHQKTESEIQKRYIEIKQRNNGHSRRT